MGFLFPVSCPGDGRLFAQTVIALRRLGRCSVIRSGAGFSVLIRLVYCGELCPNGRADRICEK